MNKLKDKLALFKFKSQYLIAAMFGFLLNPSFTTLKAYADTTIGGPNNGPTVGADGSVTLKGGDKDVTGAAGDLMKNGQFIVGLIAGVAALMLIGYGIWYGYKAGKQVQEGNQQGWGSAGKVVAGTIIGGVLMAAVALILGIGAATGNKFFG